MEWTLPGRRMSGASESGGILKLIGKFLSYEFLGESRALIQVCNTVIIVHSLLACN